MTSSALASPRSLRPRPPLLVGLELLVLSALVLALDHLSGPFLRFSVLLILPVVLATYHGGLRWGLPLAFLLPVIRLGLVGEWGLAWLLAPEAGNTAILALTLGGLAASLWRVLQLRGWALAPGGMLRVCEYCLRIRDSEGRWRLMEEYLEARSGLRLVPEICQQCDSRVPPGGGFPRPRS